MRELAKHPVDSARYGPAAFCVATDATPG
jgi:hypothetical protein